MTLSCQWSGFGNETLSPFHLSKPTSSQKRAIRAWHFISPLHNSSPTLSKPHFCPCPIPKIVVSIFQSPCFANPGFILPRSFITCTRERKRKCASLFKLNTEQPHPPHPNPSSPTKKSKYKMRVSIFHFYALPFRASHAPLFLFYLYEKRRGGK